MKKLFILALNASLSVTCTVVLWQPELTSLPLHHFPFLRCYYASWLVSCILPLQNTEIGKDAIDSLDRSHLWNLCIYINRKQRIWVMHLQCYVQHKSFTCSLFVTVCSLSKLFADTKRNWNCRLRSFALFFYLLPFPPGVSWSSLKKYFETQSHFFYELHAG